jgi:cell filamentation protein
VGERGDHRCPYVYPGTNVLRNHFGIRDATELAEREAAHSAIRIAELERRFIPGDYDTAHLRAVHRKIFGDLYPWAGELRTVKVAKARACSRCHSTFLPISPRC